MSMVSEQQMVLPRVGSVVEVKGAFYRVTELPTHNLDSLGGMFLARRIVDLNTMETTKRSVRLYVRDLD